MSDALKQADYAIRNWNLSSGHRTLIESLCSEIDRLERELEWFRSWHEDVSKALDLPDGGRYRNDAIERINRLLAKLAEKDKQIAELEQILRERDEEWDKDVGVMRSRIAELEAPVPKTFQHAIRRVVITEDNRVVYDAEEDDVGCVYIVTPEVMRTEIRPILDGWDRGHFFTEEQIDEAWTAVMQNPSAIIRSAGSALFAIFGIVACPDCGGSGRIPLSIVGGEISGDCQACKGHGWVSKPTNKEK